MPQDMGFFLPYSCASLLLKRFIPVSHGLDREQQSLHMRSSFQIIDKVFPPWVLPALQNFHLRKFKGNLAHRCQLLCKGLGGDRKKKKGKISFQGAFLLGRCMIPGRGCLWAFYTAKKIYPFRSSPWNSPVARKDLKIRANTPCGDKC